MEINTEDFYRTWILAQHGRQELDKSNPIGDAVIQRVRNEDNELLDKLRTAWKLGLTAKFNVRQVI